MPLSTSSAFRRLTDPFILPVRATPTKFDVPAGFFNFPNAANQANAFWVVNPNPFWVRLKGTSGDSPYVEVTPTTGWLFAPGFSGVFGSQFPTFMSTLAVPFPLWPIDPAVEGVLEVAYGRGS